MNNYSLVKVHFSPPPPFTPNLVRLIRLANPKSKPVVVIIFTRVVRRSVSLHFSKSRKAKNKLQMKIMIATDVSGQGDH